MEKERCEKMAKIVSIKFGPGRRKGSKRSYKYVETIEAAIERLKFKVPKLGTYRKQNVKDLMELALEYLTVKQFGGLAATKVIDTDKLIIVLREAIIKRKVKKNEY